jgi:hypothetical protein
MAFTSSSRAWRRAGRSGSACRSIPRRIRITAFLAHQTSRFTHYYFYIRDEVLGPIIIRVASFFPFHATYWLNGHSFMEQELNRKQIGFRKNDNAFLAVDDVAALQAAADRLSPQIIRQQLDYWTLILGPKFSKQERSQMSLSRFYSIAQIEYCRNFIFKRHFPIHKIFERSCEIGLWRLTASRISEIFGVRLNKRLNGKLTTVIDQIEHGHHVFRAYWKHAFLKQYEKFPRFLRNELCSNNLRDFGLKKGLDHLDAVRRRFQTITDRFAGFQAQCLNVHVDFPLLQKIALPIIIGSVRYPGIKIHDTRIIRLLEVLLHNGSTVGGWTTRQIHEAVVTTFQLSSGTYSLNQLRYDLRRLKGHGLLQRDGRRYAYRLTTKGVDVALLFLFFHKRLCGPLANSRFHHKPDPANSPSKLEAAYHKADQAIENIVHLLQAAAASHSRWRPLPRGQIQTTGSYVLAHRRGYPHDYRRGSAKDCRHSHKEIRAAGRQSALPEASKTLPKALGSHDHRPARPVQVARLDRISVDAPAAMNSQVGQALPIRRPFPIPNEFVFSDCENLLRVVSLDTHHPDFSCVLRVPGGAETDMSPVRRNRARP